MQLLIDCSEIKSNRQKKKGNEEIDRLKWTPKRHFDVKLPKQFLGENNERKKRTYSKSKHIVKVFNDNAKLYLKIYNMSFNKIKLLQKRKSKNKWIKENNLLFE